MFLLLFVCNNTQCVCATPHRACELKIESILCYFLRFPPNSLISFSSVLSLPLTQTLNAEGKLVHSKSLVLGAYVNVLGRDFFVDRRSTNEPLGFREKRKSSALCAPSADNTFQLNVMFAQVHQTACLTLLVLL
jgi:hypothetical protein